MQKMRRLSDAVTANASSKKAIVICALIVALIAIFGSTSLYSVMNTNSRNEQCRSCRDGVRPSIVIGSTVSMPCGETTVIYNSGNETSVVLNFGIPSDCAGPVGPDGNMTLYLTDSPDNLTYINSTFFVTPNLTIYVNVTETISIVNQSGPTGITGIQGIQGPQGNQGLQGPQGPAGEPLVGYGRYTTQGTYTLPIPPTASAIYFTLCGGGGGGGGGGGFNFYGSAGGGGGSGYKVTGFEILQGVSSIQVTIGAGGLGGVSHDNFYQPTDGVDGGITSLKLLPLHDVQASGGEGGAARGPFSDMGGYGGDGGYAGGGGGGVIESCPCNTPGGQSYNMDTFSTAGDGGYLNGDGGNGAGPNAGSGGAGSHDTRDDQSRYIGYTGGGGGGGGPLPNSGGAGGSFANGSLTGSGTNGVSGSGGGGGGAGGNWAGGSMTGQEGSDLITQGDTGGKGGSGYIDYIFI